MPGSNGSDAGEKLCRAVATALLTATIVLIGVLFLVHGPASAHGDVRESTGTNIIADPHVPLDVSKNVIWCGTLALAWNEAMEKYNGPLIFTPQIPLADILNRKEFTKADLDEESYVVMAGGKLDGIDKQFRDELRRKFGEAANPPQLDQADPVPGPNDVAIYAYLFKNLLFGTPFGDDEKLLFEGQKVASFGFGFGQLDTGDTPQNLTSEVRVHDYQSEDSFIIELKTKSSGDQLILAKIPPASTLQGTIDSVLPKINANAQWGLSSVDRLAIPKIDFDLTKHFSEFEGKKVSGAKLQTVAENVVFRLNEKGAVLTVFTTITETLGAVYPPPTPINFVFDKPFLILLKRESSPRPYFAMWVGNANLLVTP